MDQTRAIWDTTAVREAVRSGQHGAVVRAIRHANHLTLAELAARCSYSISTLSRLERGHQHLSDVGVLRLLAEALGVPPQLFGLADTPQRWVRSGQPGAIVGLIPASDQETDPMRRRSLLAGLSGLAGTAVLRAATPAAVTADPLHVLARTLLVRPAGGVPISLAHLRQELSTAHATFHLGRYTDLAERLPGLLSNTIATCEAAPSSDDVASGNAILGQTYTLTSKLMIKLGNDQLAWTTADRAMQSTHSSDDILAQAAAHRAWAIVLRRGGHPDDAQELVIDTAESLQAELHRGVDYLAAYGSMLATAAYTAAVDGDRDTARDLIGEARAAAIRLGDNVNHQTLGFGPTAIGVYQISIARVLGDYGSAIEAARKIDPASIPLVENRARYWSDVARAFHQWGKPEQCYRALLAAEHTAPDEVRYRKPIQQITHSLLRHPTTKSLPGLQAFAQRNVAGFTDT